MAIDFPYTDKVIKTNGKTNFERLVFPNIDFRRNPEEIEIILPTTVTRDEFTIGSTSWLNVCNFAVINDAHIGEGDPDFPPPGWREGIWDPNQSNTKIENNKNIVAA